MTLLLVLSLLGLGAADAAICWGSDGHVSLETRFNSCCRSEASEAPSAAPVDADGPIALNPAVDGAACEDTPLIQGAPLARTPDVTSGYLGQSTTILFPIDAGPAHRGAELLLGAESSLRRLRTTTLLI